MLQGCTTPGQGKMKLEQPPRLLVVVGPGVRPCQLIRIQTFGSVGALGMNVEMVVLILVVMVYAMIKEDAELNH